MKILKFSPIKRVLKLKKLANGVWVRRDKQHVR